MLIEFDYNNYRNNIMLTIFYGMQALVLIAGGIFFWLGDWESALSTILIFLLMFMPSVLKERYRLYLPFALELGIVSFIFFTLFLGQLGNLYDNLPLWDKFTHFQSGLLLGATGYILVYILNESKNIRLDISPFFISVFAVTFSLAAGVVWELMEFAGDSFWGGHWQLNNSDTMWDLIAAGIGSLIVSTVGYFWMYKHKRLPFTPWIMKVFKNRI